MSLMLYVLHSFYFLVLIMIPFYTSIIMGFIYFHFINEEIEFENYLNDFLRYHSM